MVKRKITYRDFNDTERTETFLFHLTEMEIAELEMSEDGGYAEMIQRIVDAKEQKEIVKVFKQLILMSYGEKSDDGKRFVKNDALREAFSQTAAFSQMFMELATDADKAGEFVTGIMPKDGVLQKRADMLTAVE